MKGPIREEREAGELHHSSHHKLPLRTGLVEHIYLPKNVEYIWFKHDPSFPSSINPFQARFSLTTSMEVLLSSLPFAEMHSKWKIGIPPSPEQNQGKQRLQLLSRPTPHLQRSNSFSNINRGGIGLSNDKKAAPEDKKRHLKVLSFHARWYSLQRWANLSSIAKHAAQNSTSWSATHVLFKRWFRHYSMYVHRECFNRLRFYWKRSYLSQNTTNLGEII